MARLLLHIGAHKTATSYIQRLFHLNRDLLARHGILYPDIGPNRAHHILATPWTSIPAFPEAYFRNQNLDPAPGRSVFDAFFERFAAQYAPQKGTVFISAEIFSRAPPRHVDMQDLARRLAPFEDVRIVHVVRHQTDYIQSIWLQLAKNGKGQPFDQFLDRALTRHLASDLWVDHGKVIDHVLTGFAPEQLTLLDYETARRHPEGVVGPFLDLLESPVRAGDLEELDQMDANISPDPLATWMARSICQPDPIRPGLLDKLQSALDGIRKERGKKRTTLYSRDQFQAVSEAFAEPNARLAPWFKAGSSAVPMPAPPETLLFREDLSDSDRAGLVPGKKRLQERLAALR